MTKDAKKKISKIKVKKKLWYKIVAPKLFGQKELGETYLSFPENAIGRTMQVNLKELTGNMKDQKVYVSFKINKVDGSTLRTSVLGYQLTPTSVKRMVRKNSDRLDDSFSFKTKGGKKVILKSIVITSYNTQRSVRSQIKSQLKTLFEEELGKSDFETFITNLVNYKVQTGIKKRLHKIFPVKEVAVRSLFLKNSSNEAEVIVEEKAEPKTSEDKSLEDEALEESQEAEEDVPEEDASEEQSEKQKETKEKIN
ncbi:MAG: hypothetical protein ABH824_03040 [Nanoarchaeota archaeon]|nr:hypothetical protein [Nanoarchaeota archaeon]MBU1632301.1 hypothetical protein [Nanoarchaeota archaeon]MBU1875748.1 hypothetical protein [Nanoarchaeota archaeon]